MTVPDNPLRDNAPETAIIIRTRNEERWIGETLARLHNQTNQNFEIIVVDSESTDQTVDIATQHPKVTVKHIRASEFTYPFAINVGIAASCATSYYVILSAHSLPIGSDWLESAVQAVKADDQAIGICGPLKAMPDGSFMDRIIHNVSYWWLALRYGRHGIWQMHDQTKDVFAFTNALIRKDLYDQHAIDNAFAGGGEDVAWANYWIDRGYHALKSMNFAVHHSHYLGPIGWYQQWREWKTLGAPKEFKHLDYRKDAAHDSLK